MGKLEPSVLGKIRGRVGSLVFYELRGQAIVRKRPSLQKKELTDLQKYHQLVFSVANIFLKPFREELNFSMVTFQKGGRKGYHQGLSCLIKNGIQHGEEPQVIPNQLLISMGSLTGPADARAERISIQEIKMNWSPNAWEGSARDADLSYILIYDPVKKHVFSWRGEAYRRTGYQTIQIPLPIEAENQVWVYMAFYQEKNKKRTFSNSICLGLV